VTTFLLIGLGNPGKDYAGNRHNVGFMAVEAIAKRCKFSAWSKKFRGQLAEGKIGEEKIFLLKPQTYMNLSGESAAECARFYKIPAEHIIAVHDELDLPLGKLRVKRGGGNGGHNGLRSLDQYLGENYLRVRVGIGHPGDKDAVTQYVLENFKKDEWPVTEMMVNEISRHIALLLSGDEAGFMNKIALAFQEPKPKKMTSQE
jgi:peptidyl-tRNA hydrolase, PTH1 family